jgi:arabinofuranan 3-O-arabinosyltransferase
VRLGAASRTATGQTIVFGRRSFSTLEIAVTDLNVGKRLLHSGASAVGFAEVRLRDEHASHDLRVDEVVDMPRDALNALGTTSASHPLVLVMSRERTLLVPPRLDPERNLSRQFVLPTPRTFSLTGTARLTTDTIDGKIEQALGQPSPTRGGIEANASTFLDGCANCRPGTAIDGDPATAWNSRFGSVRGQWVEYVLPQRITFNRMNLQLVADGRHSVPTRLRIEVDNASREVVVPPVADVKGNENATVNVPITFPAMTGRRVRVTIVDARPVYTYNFSTTPITMPVGIAELGVPGLRLAPTSPSLPAPSRLRSSNFPRGAPGTACRRS